MSLEMPLSLNSPTLRLHWQSQTALAAESVTMAHESQSIILMAASLYQLQHFLINKSSCSCWSGGVWACGPTQTLETCFQVFFLQRLERRVTRPTAGGEFTMRWREAGECFPEASFGGERGDSERARWRVLLLLLKWFAKIFAFKEDAEELRWRMRSLTGHCHWVCISVMKSGWLSWHFNTGDPAGNGRRTWWQ